MSDAWIQQLSACAEVALVGGKAVNLGRLIRAGFRVPGGFVLTTRAHELALSADPTGARIPDAVASELARCYRELGAGPVAVRSSATAEDMPGASMAGQFETFLNIQGEPALLDAVARCWAGLHSPRTRAYFQAQSIDPAGVRMAVVVQQMVNADVAGVLFTANPRDGNAEQSVIESSRGLGEAVVSGAVQPDTFTLDSQTGGVLERSIADPRGPSLEQSDLEALMQLGARIAQHFGVPQDIEWAIVAGEIDVLQSRPITTLDEARVDAELLRVTRASLSQQAAIGRGPWVLHNLAETLPHPTALTWSVMSEAMSGRGGLGRMYRRAGFSPSPLMNSEGFLEFIAGRIYMDAARAPQMFFEGVALAYDIKELRSNPASAQAPPSITHGSLLQRVRSARRFALAGKSLADIDVTTESHLRDVVFPAIERYVSKARAEDLRSLSVEQLIQTWREREERVLGVFAADLLLPGMIAGRSMGELRDLIAEFIWDEDAEALAGSVAVDVAGLSRALAADAELYEVGSGGRALDRWLADHGHRGADEFDLASPRWRERPELVRGMAVRLAEGKGPRERQRERAEEVIAETDRLRSRMPASKRAMLDHHIDRTRRALTLREDAKDFWMLGYDLLRSLALEVGRRLGAGEDVFHLTRTELFEALAAGAMPAPLIAKRKTERRAEGRLSLPRMIEAADLASLGNPAAPVASDSALKAFALSAGRASGPAMIRMSPTQTGDPGRGYILVCPSTDPSWTPLFAGASGLILERGGMLSHGAVVAREMGLPAVVLPDACRLFTEGESLSIDAKAGWIVRGSHTLADAHRDALAGPDDIRVAPKATPPPTGMKDRRAAMIASGACLFWLAYLLAAFVFPASWIYLPSINAMDAVLWPLVTSLGKPGTVAIIAATMAALTLLAQKCFTDNARLAEAKRRADVLGNEARSLPANAPRRAVLTGIVTGVSLRAFVAALVPIGVLLGPMVMSFAWLKDRVDTSLLVAQPGAQVRVIAMVDPDFDGVVTIDLPDGMGLVGFEGRSQKNAPIRPTLERLLALYRSPGPAASQPWEFNASPTGTHEALAADLAAYLHDGIPPQRLSWVVMPMQETAGRLELRVTSEGDEPVRAAVVVGEDTAPAPTVVRARESSPVREVRIVYPRATHEAVFFRPFLWLSDSSTLSAWDIGWVWLYVAAYLPAMLLFRRLLRVA